MDKNLDFAFFSAIYTGVILILIIFEINFAELKKYKETRFPKFSLFSLLTFWALYFAIKFL
jgi:hypothetical protein